MIDQQLILQGQQQIVNAFNTRSTTPSDRLWIINNVLSDDILKKLKEYINSVDKSKWETVAGQESLPRGKISWDSDTVIEELHEIYSALTDTINQAYPAPYKHFWGISLWKDTAGYSIDWHTDNPDIDLAIQIYLYGDGTLGTTFLINSQEFNVPGDHNSGYVAYHSDQPKPLHRSQRTVPVGQVRYSLYAVWSRCAKYVANT